MCRYSMRITILANALQNYAKILIHLDNSNSFPYKYHILVFWPSMPAWPHVIPLRYNVVLIHLIKYVKFLKILLYFPMKVTKIFVGNDVYGN